MLVRVHALRCATGAHASPAPGPASAERMQFGELLVELRARGVGSEDMHSLEPLFPVSILRETHACTYNVHTNASTYSMFMQIHMHLCFCPCKYICDVVYTDVFMIMFIYVGIDVGMTVHIYDDARTSIYRYV